MKTALLTAVLCLFASSFAAAQESKASVEGLTWMTGCWQMDGKNAGSFSSEQWTKPAGGMMLGVGRTIKDNKTVAFEFLRIVQQDGSLFYIAKPSDAAGETSFKLKTFSAREIIFENPEHDFPQRIIYRASEKGDSLFARVEGTSDGKTSSFDFQMKRVKCD